MSRSGGMTSAQYGEDVRGQTQSVDADREALIGGREAMYSEDEEQSLRKKLESLEYM